MPDLGAFGWAQLFAAINAAAVCIGVGIAVWGIRKWRVEQIGKRQCELAEDALALIYESHDVFEFIRCPIIWISTEEEKALNENPVRRYLSPIERTADRSDYFARVQMMRPRFKALFGVNAANPLDEILEIRANIIFQAHRRAELDAECIGATDNQLAEIRREKKQSVRIVMSSNRDDPIKQRLANAVAEMESTVRPILNSKYRI